MPLSCGTNQKPFSYKDFQNFDCSDKVNSGIHKRGKYTCCTMLTDCTKCKETDFDCTITCPSSFDAASFGGIYIPRTDGNYVLAQRNDGLNNRTSDEIDNFCDTVTCGPPKYIIKLAPYDAP